MGRHPAFGMCVPSSCSREEVQTGLFDMGRQIASDSPVSYLFLVGSCSSEAKKPEFDAVDGGFA